MYSSPMLASVIEKHIFARALVVLYMRMDSRDGMVGLIAFIEENKIIAPYNLLLRSIYHFFHAAYVYYRFS